MPRGQYTGMLVAVALSGFAGGAFSEYFLSPRAEAQGGREIRAENFVLEHAKDRAGATLTYRDNRPSLSLTDDDGKNRILLGFDGTGNPFMTFLDKFNNKERLSIYTAFDGAPFIQLNDKNGDPRAILGSQDDGSVVLEFYDKGGRPIWVVPKFLK